MTKAEGYLIVLCIFLFCVLGCSKSSSLEGKIVDGKGKPLGGVYVKMIEPLTGYKDHVSVTDRDGIFKFRKLSPSSVYPLVLNSDKWVTEQRFKIESGPEGKMKILTEPITVRFIDSKEGVITDTKTGLEWFTGPDQETTWYVAYAWVTNLNIAGGGWRMPTRAKLKDLYVKGLGDRNIHPIFDLDSCCVWSGEKRDSSNAWYFYFHEGIDEPGNLSTGKVKRAFAVR